MKQTLAKFAAHTRHTQEECEDVETLGKKYVAVHLGSAVYQQVLSDYKALHLRTYNPPLQTYEVQPIDADVFVNMLRRVDANPESARGMAAFGHFCDTLFPKPVGEEAWVEYSQKDGWKKRAYFVALPLKDRPNFYALVSAIHGGSGGGKEDVDAFYSRLNRYSTPKALMPHVAAEIGTILSSIHLPHEEGVEPIECSDPGPRHVESDDEEAGEHVSAPIRRSIEFAPLSAPIAAALAHEDGKNVMDEYRKRAVLPPTFPRSKLVKQMILSSLGVSTAEDVMSANQKVFPSVPIEAWPVLMNLYDAMAHPTALASEADAEWVRDLALNVMKTEKPDPTLLLKTAISLYGPIVPDAQSVEEARARQKYLTRFPKVHDSLIKQVVLF